MADFWSYIKKLFSSAEESTPSNPAVHEIIKRSEEEQADYAKWKKSLIKRRMIDWLHQEYAAQLSDHQNVDDSIDFLNTPSSKGFVIHFHNTNYTAREVTHLFDYFKERVLEFNYRPYLSDLRTYNRPHWVESVHRHYLKPRPSFEKVEKFDQQFGNITIEMVERDDKVHNLKFRATAYKDHMYQDAGDFGLLMSKLALNE